MKLIFVYNADSGPLNAVLDGLHKVVSPGTYPCELCALTYGTALEKKEWKAFRRQSRHEMVFYHRDEFEEVYVERFTYPVVLAEKDEGLEPVLTKEQMAEMSGVEDLIASLEALEGAPEVGREKSDSEAHAAERIPKQGQAGEPHFDWVMDAE